jgi:hypothetical protein
VIREKSYPLPQTGSLSLETCTPLEALQGQLLDVKKRINNKKSWIASLQGMVSFQQSELGVLERTQGELEESIKILDQIGRSF